MEGDRIRRLLRRWPSQKRTVRFYRSVRAGIATSVQLLAFAKSVFLGLGVQKLPMDAEAARSLGAIAFRFRQRFGDQPALQPFNRGRKMAVVVVLLFCSWRG